MIEDHRNLTQKLILLTLLTAILVGIWLRFQPWYLLSSGIFPKVLSTDPWFTLRQIELMITHFPSPTWTDPFSSFPTGKPIDWGPTLPWIGAALCIITGSTSSAAMISLASWIPILCFIPIIPIGYYLGRTIADARTGIFTALILTLIPGNFLLRTMYGYVDHHCLEILLSAAFALCYLLALRSTERESKSWVYPVLAGLVLSIGILNSISMVLMVFICLIFSGIHLIRMLIARIDISRFSLQSTIIWGTGLLGPAVLVLTGLPGGSEYILHPLEISLFLLTIPLMCGILMLFSRIAQHLGVTPVRELLVWVLLMGGSVIIPYIAFPSLTQRVLTLGQTFFFLSNSYVPVGEMQAWSLDLAVGSYHLLLPLFAAGMILSAYLWMRERDPGYGFLFIWAGICLFATIQHVRNEYFLAVPLVLLASIILSRICEISLPEKKTEEEPETEPSVRSREGSSQIGMMVSVLILASILITCGIVSTMIAYADYSPQVTSDDMIEGMIWLGDHSPDPGIDYSTRYEPQFPFPYPDQAYGVLSWWEAGHVMSYFSHRPVIADPFQFYAGQSARFFMSQSEKAADQQGQELRARYIVTDADMLFDDLAIMSQTYNPYQSVNDYYGYVSVADPVNNTSHNEIGFKQPFYESMVARLHVFDGSASTGKAPVSSGSTVMQVPGTDMIVEFPGVGQDSSISSAINEPVESINALRHYRLIWESNTSLSTSDSHDIRKVKIFKRVFGASVNGTGTIEVPLVTNQGREFVYRQESVNGTFTVPYATTGNSYQVRALGPYRIVETGEEIQVSEDEVLEG